MKKISLIGGGLVASKFIKKILNSNFLFQYYYPTSNFEEFNNLTIQDCKNLNLNITYEIDKLYESDLIISAGNHKIIDKNFLDRNFIINFHAAPLPKYGGSAGPAFALINSEKEFGCTFQKMNHEIDSGPILEKFMFKIESKMTSFDIDKKAINLGESNLLNTLNNYFFEETKFNYIEPKKLIVNKREYLKKFSFIKKEDLNNDKSIQIIKALTWPGVLDPAYTVIENQKIYLIYNQK